MSPTYPGVDVPDPALQKATRLGLVVDQNRCVGCWSCSVACKEEQNVPIGMYWLRVLTVGGDAMDVPAGTFPDLKMAYQPTQCFQCDNPPCVKACPTQATFKMANGIVNVDYERCIGCRYCMVACPYDNRVFNWRKPVQEPPASVTVGRRDAAAVQGRRREVHLLRAAHRQGPAAALRRGLPGRRPLLRRPRRPQQHGVGAAA